METLDIRKPAIRQYRLEMFGGLKLRGSSLSPHKQLVLLAYLTLNQKAQARKHIAELFWRYAADSLNSLSVALKDLRNATTGVIEADRYKVQAILATDVQDFLTAVRAKDHKYMLRLYKGPFLYGVDLSRLGEDLSNWVLEQREYFAAHMQESLLHLAEEAALGGKLSETAHYTEAAYQLAEASPLDPQQLKRYYQLLLAAYSPLALSVAKEAAEFGLSFGMTRSEALQTLVGQTSRKAQSFLTL